MSRSKLIKIIVAIIILVVIGVVGWSYLKPKPQAPDYITAEVTQGDLQSTVLATGTLDATKIVSVGSQVSGQVKKMYVSLGQQVKQGDVIAQIDSTSQQNALRTAEANIQQLQAQRLQQIANRTKAEQEYQRQKAMYAQDATSQADYESALASYKTAQAQIAAIDAQIKSAEITRDTAKTDIGYTHIVAPMDGTIVAIVTEEGQTVNANQSAPTIVKLAKLDNMTIKAEISEADVMKVQAGQTVYFTTLGDTTTKRYATLRQIEPAPESISSDSTTTSSSTAIYYNALFDVPNVDGKLRIDMTANVTIILAEAKNALIIPATTLVNNKANKTTTSGSNASQTNKAQNNQTASNNVANGNKSSSLVRLNLSAEEQQQIQAGHASLATVRVLQADHSIRLQQILIGINNRVDVQVIKGLKKGEKVIIADGADSSNNAAKRSNNNRPPMGM